MTCTARDELGVLEQEHHRDRDQHRDEEER
jgi:hypothetical protein